MYRFYLRRRFAGRAPDLLVVRQGGRAVSGCGVNYRSIRLANGATVGAGVLTGAWTLPEYRGRGLFGRVTDAALGVIARCGCALALAFVRERNASSGVLRRLGAEMLPTTYWSSALGMPAGPADDPGRTSGRGPRVRPVPAAFVRSAAARETALGTVRFDYPHPDEWRRQFLARPHPVETVAIGDCAAILERCGDVDRLLLLNGPPMETDVALGALARRARRGGRRFVSFQFGGRSTDRPGPAEMTPEPGHLTLFVTGREALAAALARTRREKNAAGDGLSPRARARLATWMIQPGDRM